MKKFINIGIFVVSVVVIICFMSSSKGAIEIVKDFQVDGFDGQTINDLIEGYKGTKKVSWRLDKSIEEPQDQTNSSNLANLEKKRAKILEFKKAKKINRNIADIKLSSLEREIKELKINKNITTVVCEIELYPDMVALNQEGLRYNPSRYEYDIFNAVLQNGEFTKQGWKIILQINFNINRDNLEEIDYLSQIIVSKNKKTAGYGKLVLRKKQTVLKILAFDSQVIFEVISRN